MGRSVNNKIILALSAIGSQRAEATEETADAIEQLLDYVAVYPDDSIIFRRSDMILVAHADTVFINKSKHVSEQATISFAHKNTPRQNSMAPSKLLHK